MEHIEETSERRGDGYVNLALLTDGLRAEREQGITIDVAYRSFVTTRRRFQLADAPGHVQYTRNMVTGRVDGGRRRRPARRPQGRRRADPPPLVHRRDARHSASRLRRQQDGPGRLRRGTLPRDRDRAPRRSPSSSASGTRLADPDLGAPRRQRRRPLRGDGVVRRPDAARAPRDRRDRRRPQRRRTAASPCSG